MYGNKKEMEITVSFKVHGFGPTKFQNDLFRLLTTPYKYWYSIGVFILRVVGGNYKREGICRIR